MNPKVKNFFVIIASALRTIFCRNVLFGGFLPFFEAFPTTLIWGISYNFFWGVFIQGQTRASVKAGAVLAAFGGISIIHAIWMIFWSIEVIWGKLFWHFVCRWKLLFVRKVFLRWFSASCHVFFKISLCCSPPSYPFPQQKEGARMERPSFLIQILRWNFSVSKVFY